ncbi:hypothetical protein [Planomonospora parontospora]|uniref:hypothetical protein n=1 Tax=Planomonospora parontospora TaxID=58119 RepID=UPI0016711033|nr:hypothetical protein [Planomonospora parontospora]GGL01814.1 hypothetical protein GCM10014719_00020 [Planomonospora parontospora subsp. antibiotica]GII16826.1 hypothetical protein Ppa05_35520 [Planomonospora parontospora subsp. antibiotica]
MRERVAEQGVHAGGQVSGGDRDGARAGAQVGRVLPLLGEQSGDALGEMVEREADRADLGRTTGDGPGGEVAGGGPLRAGASSAPVTGSTPSGSTPSATSGEDASAPPATGPGTGRSRAISTAGGNVIARCDGGLVVLRAWSPAQGFQVDDVERGPTARARVEFESDEADVKVEVRCGADGLPAHRVHD